MNKNRVKGWALLIVGKLQERAGWAIGSPTQQVKGFQNQILGKSRIAIGDAQEAVKACVKTRCGSI